MEYSKRLAKMKSTEFRDEMKKFFTGKAEKCDRAQATDCKHYGKHKKECIITNRKNCEGCSFYACKEVKD